MEQAKLNRIGRDLEKEVQRYPNLLKIPRWTRVCALLFCELTNLKERMKEVNRQLSDGGDMSGEDLEALIELTKDS